MQINQVKTPDKSETSLKWTNKFPVVLILIDAYYLRKTLYVPDLYLEIWQN